MAVALCFVVLDGEVLLVPGVLFQPEFYPAFQRDPGGLEVVAVVDVHSGGLHLLPDLLLGFAGKGLLDLLSCAGIGADGDPRLPEGVLSAVAGDRLFADGAAAGGCFFRHDLLLSVAPLRHFWYNERTQDADDCGFGACDCTKLLRTVSFSLPLVLRTSEAVSLCRNDNTAF